MEATAITRYLRISPRKMRLVIDTIRRKPVPEAFSILAHLKKRASNLVAKTLKSAQANAKGKKMDEDRLYVREIRADGGPMLKRYMSRSMGRADVILKRTTHLTVVLGERDMVRISPSSAKGEKETQAKLLSTEKRKKHKQMAAAAG